MLIFYCIKSYLFQQFPLLSACVRHIFVFLEVNEIIYRSPSAVGSDLISCKLQDLVTTITGMNFFSDLDCTSYGYFQCLGRAFYY